MNDADHTSQSPPPSSSPAGLDSAPPSVPPLPWGSPVHVIVQPTGGSVRRILTWFGWAGFLLCALALASQWSVRRDYYDTSEGIREQYHSGAENGTDKVAIIAVRGVILEGDGFVKRQIDRVREDDRVKAVVLRVESPGGTVTGSDYIYHHLRKLREERDIPLVVSMGSIATSGGYYVSMAVGDQQKSIFAEPTTTTGSIGVIVPHYDISGLLARYEVQDDSISSHPRKQILSMTRSMSSEDRQIIQQYVDESFNRFKSIVKSGRPALRQANQEEALVAPQSQRDLATGEIFTALQAEQYGLVDEIGFIEDAIDRALQLAGLEADQVRVVQYQRPASLMNLVGFAQASEQNHPLYAVLEEMSVPRAHHLATSLPPSIHSRRP